MVAELERDVEARSAVLKKELGLRDLVLAQVVFVVGTIWVGWAAKLGYDQNVSGSSRSPLTTCRSLRR